MTAIPRDKIDHPSVWTPESIGGKEGLVYTLTPQHLDAFDELLARTGHLAPQAVTRADFDHPVITPLLTELLDIIQNGRGAVVVSGLTPDRYDPEAFERIYWGMGTHWGQAATQSLGGDKLGRVTKTDVGPQNPTDRGYKSDRELRLHTDSHEIVGLMCVEKAVEGGWSMLASSAAVFNRFLETRPDLLEAAFEGYYMATKEASATANPVSELKIPMFCYEGGLLSSMFHRIFYPAADQIRGDMPDAVREAMDVFTDICDSPEFCLTFMLEPGEISVFNNFAVLHARTDFKDSPEQKRCLLRLWVAPENKRPVCDAYRKRAGGYGPGRTEAKVA